MIDLFFTCLKKTMIGLTFVLFGFFVAYAPVMQINDQPVNVEIAHALPVSEVGGNFFTNILTTIQSTGTFILDNVVDGIAWAIAKQFISNMVADTINWINSGFEGRPAFIQDLGDEVLRAADQAAGRRINELGGLGSLVCEPFQVDVQLAFAIEYDRLRNPQQERECTLTGVLENVDGAFEDFIGGDFQRGGWAGWFDLTSNPQNTPYGAIVDARAQAGIVFRNSQNETVTLANWGSGTLSFKQCDNAPGPEGPDPLCRIVKPGATIADRLNKSLGMGENALIEADEINEIVGALIGQLANTALTGARGLLGLSSGTGETYSGYSRGSFTADLANDGVINNNVNAGGSTGGDIVGGLGTTTNAALVYMEESLEYQNIVLNDIDQYILELDSFQQNPFNDEEDRVLAELFLNQAEDIRDRVSDDFAEAQPIVQQYITLELDYEDADAVGRVTIRQQQSNLVQDFSEIGLITEREYESYTAQWSDLVEVSGGNIFDPCDPNNPDYDPSVCLN